MQYIKFLNYTYSSLFSIETLFSVYFYTYFDVSWSEKLIGFIDRLWESNKNRVGKSLQVHASVQLHFVFHNSLHFSLDMSACKEILFYLRIVIDRSFVCVRTEEIPVDICWNFPFCCELSF